jgi:prepilin-type N-terminal cleavage/methylation domain-containing protein
MIRKQDGFSLVELLVALVIFSFVIAAATGMFIPLVYQFKQQSKIAETNIEGIVGLEILRADLEHAGFGLPWYFPDDPANAFTYTEATVAPANSGTSTITYNDSPNTFPPRPVVAGDNLSLATTVNGNTGITGIVHGTDAGSDYLVIKATGVSGTITAQKWTYITNENEPKPRTLGSSSYDLTPTQDRVIVIKPKVSDTRLRELVMDGSTFFTTYSATAFPANFSPARPAETYLIYGVDPSDLTRPFNRADYYVGYPAALPQRCAVGTGILYKAVLQADGTFPAVRTTQLLDCVADMQVVLGFDMDLDGIIGTYSNADGTTVADAGNITGQNEGKSSGEVQNILRSHSDLADYRSCLQEVRVYILAHEGQKDPNYTYPNSNVIIGPTKPDDPASLYLTKQVGRAFDFTKSGIADWQNYRWKLYTVVVKLRNTR